MDGRRKAPPPVVPGPARGQGTGGHRAGHRPPKSTAAGEPGAAARRSGSKSATRPDVSGPGRAGGPGRTEATARARGGGEAVSSTKGERRSRRSPTALRGPPGSSGPRRPRASGPGTRTAVTAGTAAARRSGCAEPTAAEPPPAEVPLTHPEKVLFPASHITQGRRPGLRRRGRAGTHRGAARPAALDAAVAAGNRPAGHLPAGGHHARRRGFPGSRCSTSITRWSTSSWTGPRRCPGWRTSRRSRST